MKKLYVFLIAILLLTGCTTKLTQLKIQDEFANINEYYIYGTHLNLNGNFEIPEYIKKDEIKNVILVLTDTYIENSINYNLNYSISDQIINYQLTELKNRGVYLDALEINEYVFLLKLETNKQDYYFRINNRSNYLETEYFTMSRNNKINKIELFHNHRINSFGMNVTLNQNNENIYDVIIDAGHGGKDKGACYHGYCETDFTLTLANKLKDKLSDYGITATLTWNQDKIDSNSFVPTYGEGSRTGRAYETKAKYLFSFHLNAYQWQGVEIYGANKIDTTLARDIATNIVTHAHTTYSNKQPLQVAPGVYNRRFNNQDIEEFAKSVKDKHEPYPITLETEYYYLIRETAGYINGAYIDGRNTDSGSNIYRTQNVGIEAYIMEIGYISNENDLNKIKNNMNLYVEAIAKGIVENVYSH